MKPSSRAVRSKLSIPRPGRARAGGLVAGLLVLGSLGALRCNAFRSLEDCAADSDCAAGLVCEPRAKRCIPARDASLPLDAAVPDVNVPDTRVPDGEADGAVRCESLPWGAPKPVNGLENEPIISARLSPDEMTMFISRGVPPTFTDIYTVARNDVSSPFRVIGALPIVNEPGTSEFWPTSSADGKLLFFESSRSTVPNEAGVYTSAGARVWSATRVNTATDFDKPRLQTLFDVAGPEAAPYLHPSGASLYFASRSRPGKGELDIWVAEINASSGVVVDIRNVEAVNSTTDENAPVVTRDDRFLYHNRLSNDFTENDIWVAKRSTPADGFGKSVRVQELSSLYDEYPSWVSNDHCRLYFASTRPIPGAATIDAGGDPVFHLWLSER